MATVADLVALAEQVELPERESARLRMEVVRAHAQQWNYTVALERGLALWEVVRASPDRALEAQLLDLIQEWTRDQTLRLELVDRLVELRRELGEAAELARALVTRGGLRWRLGDEEASQADLSAAERMLDDLPPRERAWVLQPLAFHEAARGRLERAHAFGIAAYDAIATLAPHDAVLVNMNLALVEHELGLDASARERILEVVSAMQNHPDSRVRSVVHANVAVICRLHEPELAAEHLQAATDVAKEAGAVAMWATFAALLSRVLLDAGELEAAQACARDVLSSQGALPSERFVRTCRGATREGDGGGPDVRLLAPSQGAAHVVRDYL
jgi:hypothetical protein